MCLNFPTSAMEAASSAVLGEWCPPSQMCMWGGEHCIMAIQMLRKHCQPKDLECKRSPFHFKTQSRSELNGESTISLVPINEVVLTCVGKQSKTIRHHVHILKYSSHSCVNTYAQALFWAVVKKRGAKNFWPPYSNRANLAICGVLITKNILSHKWAP